MGVGVEEKSALNEAAMTEEKQHQWIVDSLEENVAAVEMDGDRIIFVPAIVLPSGAKEGDVYKVRHTRSETASHIGIELDEQARERLLARSRQQAVNKAGRDKGGHIRL
jgi:hypothetical protein